MDHNDQQPQQPQYQQPQYQQPQYQQPQYQQPYQPYGQQYQPMPYRQPEQPKSGRGKALLVVLVLLGVIAAAVLLLLKFGHTHDWAQATCDEPRTCTVCGTTEGLALGHQWRKGDCTNPAVCGYCGAVDGVAPGHQMVAATVEKPETCSVCGLTKGRSLGALLTSYPVLADSNANENKRDVSVGAWSDFRGNLYADAIRFWVADFGTYNDSEYIEYSLDGKYGFLELTVAQEKNSEKNTSVKILVYADSELVYESGWLDKNTAPETVMVDISGCKVLRVLCTTDSAAFCYGVARGVLYNMK